MMAGGVLQYVFSAKGAALTSSLGLAPQVEWPSRHER
jgi:hypothetical protein